MQNNKSKSTGIIISAVAIVLIGIGAAAYALLRPAPESGTEKTSTTTTTQQSESTSTPTEESDPAAQHPTIVFTDDGFSQETYTFPAGTQIKVDNQSSMDMQFSSDDHPTHRKHSELNMELLGAGKSGTFTPPGKGTYGFHDHINDQFEGTLIIE